MPLPIPKPPRPNGNPPPYDPKGDLAERCAKAEAELERVTADRDNETKWAKQYHDDWVKVRDELEHVQKREAAMREALGFALECANELLEYNGENFQFNMRGKIWSLKTRSGAALQPDAGDDRNQPFTCFSCRDGNTPLYCLNCAGDILKTKTQDQLDAMAAVVRSAYVHKDEVRKLVDALRMAELYVETEGSDEERSLLCKAFAHANSLIL